MITLIGFRCTHRKVLSREVLISRFLLGNLKITAGRACALSGAKAIICLHNQFEISMIDV